ncbi:MAG TPA: hypothetical protein VEU47_04930 [Candidatus Cybelea sp.]|nr:hypothetical protein [Candidatus Cybelea sp.]
MQDDSVRDDIAFIRRTIEEGRTSATDWGGFLIMWGLYVALAQLATYAFVRRWSPLDPNWIWNVFILLPWAYSIYLVRRRRFARRRTLQGRTLLMLWFGLGIFLTLLGFLMSWSGDVRQGWLMPVSEGALGVAYFTIAALCGIPWMRWVAAGWWLGMIATFLLHDRAEVLLIGAALMLLLQVAPGIVLLRIAPAAKGA